MLPIGCSLFMAVKVRFLPEETRLWPEYFTGYFKEVCNSQFNKRITTLLFLSGR